MLIFWEYSKMMYSTLCIVVICLGIISQAQESSFSRAGNLRASNLEELDQAGFVENHSSTDFKAKSRHSFSSMVSTEASVILKHHGKLNRTVIIPLNIHITLGNETEKNTVSQTISIHESDSVHRNDGSIFDLSSELSDMEKSISKDNRAYPLLRLRQSQDEFSDIDVFKRGAKGRKHHKKNLKIADSRASNFGRRSSSQCPKLSVPTGAAVICTDGRKVGSTCKLSCPTMASATGKTTRRCKVRKHRTSKRNFKATAQWSGRKDDFQCMPICEHQAVPNNGERTCEIVESIGGKVLRCTTKCNIGYKIVGESVNYCKENGKWSDEQAVCKGVANTRHAVKNKFKFREHQTLPCGETYRLTSYRRHGVVHLVVGDKANNLVKIFQWNDGKFEESPFQTITYSSPNAVEVLPDASGGIWLIVDGGDEAIMFWMGHNGRFRRSHVTTQRLVSYSTDSVRDAIAFAELGGEYYRCYGRNRRETPVIVVQKLQTSRSSGGDAFKRVMRKKFPGEKVNQCSMFAERDSLYTVAALHKPDGQGRILIGHVTKNRMKVVDVISDDRLHQMTDSHGFSIGDERYIVASQSVQNGRCFVYKRHWRTRFPQGTG